MDDVDSLLRPEFEGIGLTHDSIDQICKSIVLTMKKECFESGQSETELEEEVVEEEDSEELVEDGQCVLCERFMPLTQHHLIPRQMHRRMKNVPKETLNLTLEICRQCHSHIHRVITNKEMAAYYHTLERLLEHESVISWCKWASKQRTYSKAAIRKKGFHYAR